MGNYSSAINLESKHKTKSTLYIRKKPRPNHSVQTELLVIGYCRNIHSFHCICTVVLSYYHQSHAKYISIDGSKYDGNQLNSIIKHKTFFGDIIQIKYECSTPFFAVIGDNTLHPCFIVDESLKYMEIPFEICSKLDNTLQYYSKLMSNHDILQSGIHRWNFIIKHNDNYLYHQFNGYFKYQYEPIKLSFNQNKLQSFIVGFDKHNETIFFNERWAYSFKDIDDFYRIRNKKKRKKLIIIEIMHKSDDFKQNMYNKNIMFPSGKWEYQFKLKDHMWSEYFIGPSNEQQYMLNIMQKYYNRNVFDCKQIMDQHKDKGYGSYMIIPFIPNAFNLYDTQSRSVSSISRWDLELEDEEQCMTITPSKLKEIIIKCPSRTHLYPWKLFYNTERDGLSTNTMYHNLSNIEEWIIIIQNDNNDIFGAFMDCKWIKPLTIKKKKGKISYRGSIDCFVWKYNERKLSVYNASAQSPYFFRNDIKGITIGAGECSAIYFDYNFNLARSVCCDSFNSPCLASKEQFRIIKFEIWAPNYTL